MEIKIVEFKVIKQEDGNLLVFERNNEIPFEIKRIFSIYNVPAETERANHASINSKFLLQAIVGCVEVELDNGVKQERIILDKIECGLYVPAMTWIRIRKFSCNAILQVYASEKYENCKYIDDYYHFLEKAKERQ